MRQVGWICAAAQGIKVKDRRQVPAELGGQVQAATGKDAVWGRLSGFGLQYALMHADERALRARIRMHLRV